VPLSIPFSDFIPGSSIVSAEADANNAAIKAFCDGLETDITALESHVSATNAHGATSAATADRIVQRDVAGRAKFAAPSASDDIAIKQTVDDHAALTSAHNATTLNTAGRIVLRDSNGRSQFSDPSVAQDAATKNYVDNKTRTRLIVLTAAGAITPTTGGAAQTKVDGTNHTFYVLDYDPAADEHAYWQFAVPDDYDGGNITVTIVYKAVAAITGAVVWNCRTLGITDGEVWDAALGTAQAVTDTVEDIATEINEVSFTAFSPGWAAGDQIIFEVTRDADNASDTLAEDARLLMVKIAYTGK